VCGQFLFTVWHTGREDLKNDNASNITIDLVGESLTHLIGTFIGPEDTPYHDGTYEVVSTPRPRASTQEEYSHIVWLILCWHVCNLLPPSEGVYAPGSASEARCRVRSVTDGAPSTRPSCRVPVLSVRRTYHVSEGHRDPRSVPLSAR
jgi:hypothetical protein